MPNNRWEADQLPVLPADAGQMPVTDMDTASMQAPESQIELQPSKGPEPPEASEIAGKRFPW